MFILFFYDILILLEFGFKRGYNNAYSRLHKSHLYRNVQYITREKFVMETLESIKKRRSIRKFADKPVEHDVVRNIVESASFAPSWKNTQITRYTFIDDKDVISTIANDGVMGFEFNQKTLSNAPALFVLSYVTGRSGFERDGSFTTSKEDRWQMFDAGIAAQTLCLSAAEYGIGTVIMGIFDDEKIAKIVNLPKDEQVAALVACGYPDETPQPPKRKGTDDLLRIITTK